MEHSCEIFRDGIFRQKERTSSQSNLQCTRRANNTGMDAARFLVTRAGNYLTKLELMDT